jgi:endonuclease YncB( thermonuclease family)
MSGIALAKESPFLKEDYDLCTPTKLTGCIYKKPVLDTTNFQEIKYERTIDGDTFVGNGRTIRLWGIDAPEEDSRFGFAAKLMLQTLINEGDLKCRTINIDKYDRYVMHCLIDTIDVGSMMVQMGTAKDFPECSGGYYQEEQNAAQSKSLVIWKKQQ